MLLCMPLHAKHRVPVCASGKFFTKLPSGSGVYISEGCPGSTDAHETGLIISVTIMNKLPVFGMEHGDIMEEAYSAVAYGLRDIGLPASTFLVKQFLSRNDFEGLLQLLQDTGERCEIAQVLNAGRRLRAQQ